MYLKYKVFAYWASNPDFFFFFSSVGRDHGRKGKAGKAILNKKKQEKGRQQKQGMLLH